MGIGESNLRFRQVNHTTIQHAKSLNTQADPYIQTPYLLGIKTQLLTYKNILNSLRN